MIIIGATFYAGGGSIEYQGDTTKHGVILSRDLAFAAKNLYDYLRDPSL